MNPEYVWRRQGNPHGERNARIYRMRESGMTYAAIASAVGLKSKEHVRGIVCKTERLMRNDKSQSHAEIVRISQAYLATREFE